MVVPTFVACSPQDAPAAPAPRDGTWLGALADFATRPGVVETLLAAAVVVAMLLVWWRLARQVTGARSRRSLGDYLLGVEQALHGDLAGARERLQAVVQNDPQNHYARLLLGKVLAELGEPAEAHTQHLYLQRAFGIDSPENELALAESLLAAGMATEAADAAERVLQKVPRQATAQEFVYRARLQSGDFEAAANAGRKLLDMLREGPRRAAFRRDLARTIAQSGALRLQHKDTVGATAALQQARRLDPDAGTSALLAARLAALQNGVEATVTALLDEPKSDAAMLPATVAAALPAVASGPTTGLPTTSLAGLVAPDRWSCRACGVPLGGPVAECPRCQSRDPARLAEAGLVGAIASPTHTMDAIDVNDAHVERLVRVVLDGEGAARVDARRQLVELRERATEELLRQAWHRSGDAQEVAIDVLRAMGPEITASLFAASDALEAQRLLPLGSRSPAALVGRIVQGFDRAALPHVGSLFAKARPEHRKILIDFFLGLADLQEFQIVLERFPPLEILHRFNKADAEVLRRFLQAVPPGHFVAESLLLEPTFYREEVVLAALPDARHPDVLRQALLRRGPTRALTGVLIDALGEPRLAEASQQLLADLGTPVLDHVLSAWTDRERAEDERVRLIAVLNRLGAAAVPALCASFGPEPSVLDDELRSILVAIGDRAVLPLQTAYGQSGWIEKVSIGLISRHTNRRVQIVATLRELGSAAAIDALRALVAVERDANLRLRLQQALHDTNATKEADHGRP